jgi:hypothetical protein
LHRCNRLLRSPLDPLLGDLPMISSSVALRRLSPLSLALVAAFVVACSDPKPVAPEPPPPPPPPPVASATVVEAPKEAPEPVAEAPKGPTPVFKLGGFATPESVTYDATNDRYIVANISGRPTAVDNNGYLSIVSPEGKILTEKWIAGGVNKVTLNAPKGVVLAGGLLYVADLDTVRMFDEKTAAPKGEVKIKGATFLNDLAVGADGTIYVSDSGLKQNEKGDFEPTGSDAVYAITKGKAKPLAKDKSLNRPNGLWAAKDGVWVVTFGAAELYRLDAKGAKQDVVTLPKGSLDGLVAVGDTLYVSSWESSTIYKGSVKGPFEVFVEGVKSPAEMGFDTKRSRLLVPRFLEDTIEVYEVK